MAPSESTASPGGNVTDLAEARRLRDQSNGQETASDPSIDGVRAGATPDASANSGSAGADKTIKVAGSGKATGTTGSGKKKSTANRRFDTEKVERLKAEIAAGSYRMDPLRVADKFIEHDRNA